MMVAGPKPSPAAQHRRPQDVDRHVGVRIRERRIMLGLTQQDLAERVGTTYQQLHRYERGLNRVAAGQLHAIAKALGVELAYLFEGIDDGGAAEAGPQQRALLSLVRDFLAMSDWHRSAVCELARVLAEPAAAPAGEAVRGTSPSSSADGPLDPLQACA